MFLGFSVLMSFPPCGCIVTSSLRFDSQGFLDFEFREHGGEIGTEIIGKYVN